MRVSARHLINIDPAILSKVSRSDPGNLYGVVYLWDTYGISFNRKLVTERLPKCLSLGYSGDFVQASKRAKQAKNGIDLGYMIPEEGSLEGFDLLAIPRDAPHPSNAYRLINYLMEPRVAANISNAIGNANANLAATALLDKSVVSNTAIYPTQDQQQRLFVHTDTSSEQSRIITRIWQKFRTGQ